MIGLDLLGATTNVIDSSQNIYQTNPVIPDMNAPAPTQAVSYYPERPGFVEDPRKLDINRDFGMNRYVPQWDTEEQAMLGIDVIAADWQGKPATLTMPAGAAGQGKPAWQKTPVAQWMERTAESSSQWKSLSIDERERVKADAHLLLQRQPPPTEAEARVFLEGHGIIGFWHRRLIGPVRVWHAVAGAVVAVVGGVLVWRK